MNLKQLFLGIYLCSSISTFCQSKDSIEVHFKTKIRQAATDSLKIHHWFALTKAYENNAVTKAEEFMQEAIIFMDSITTPSNYVLSKKAKAYAVLGKFQAQQNNYKKALAYQFKALDIEEKLPIPYNAGHANHAIATLYRDLKEYNKAKRYYKKALAIRKQLKNPYRSATSYNMLGITYFYNKQYDSALYCYNKAKILHTKPRKIAKVQTNLAALYFTSGKYQKALQTYFELANTFNQNKDFITVTIIYNNIAKTYLELKQYRQALYYVDKAIQLSQSIQYTKRLAQLYLLKSVIYEQSGRYQFALQYYKNYKLKFDSIHNIKRAKELTTLELTHKFEKEKLLLLNKEKALEYQSKTEKAKNQLYLILLSVAILIAALLYALLRYRKKVNQEKLKKNELEKELLNTQIKTREHQAKTVIADNSMRLTFIKEFLEKLKVISKQETKDQSLKSLINDLKSHISTEHKLSEVSQAVQQFEELFDKKLLDQYPKLTKSEREICALIRLNLTLKEIMIIRNVSLNSIKSSRYRIRKKMNIPKDTSLEVFIQQLFLDHA